MTESFETRLIENFRANGGAPTGEFANFNVVLVNTIGAKTGETRTVPLAHLRQGDRVFVVGSAGGSPRHPAWYFNLLANPEMSYELGPETIPATATLLAGQERATAWTDIVAALPFFGDYQQKMERKIPVFALDRR